MKLQAVLFIQTKSVIQLLLNSPMKSRMGLIIRYQFFKKIIQIVMHFQMNEIPVMS